MELTSSSSSGQGPTVTTLAGRFQQESSSSSNSSSSHDEAQHARKHAQRNKKVRWEEEDKYYDADYIINHRFIRADDGATDTHYLVKWDKYSEGSNSWVPLDYFHDNAMWMVREYESQTGAQAKTLEHIKAVRNGRSKPSAARSTSSSSSSSSGDTSAMITPVRTC